MALGLAALGSFSAQAADKTFNFDTDPSGVLDFFGTSVWTPTGGNPATGGFLEVTSALASQKGTIIFDDFDAGLIVKSFTFSMDLKIGDGTANPADGFSINYCSADDPLIVAHDGNGWAASPGNEANLPEEGTQTGLGVGFDAWNSGSGDIIGISVRMANVLLTQIPMPTLNGAATDPTSLQTGPRANGDGLGAGLTWQPLRLQLDENAVLNIWWKNVQIVTNLQTTFFPRPARIVFGGRTGGSWQLQSVDNIHIVTVAAGSAVPGVGWLQANSVRAYQRPGTTLVDLYYDLSGAGSGYSVSVTVSSDAGASFIVPATHFTGDGVASPAVPGASRHIVWDAGADFPGQFSTKMRIKVAVGSAVAVSPIFTLDTRAVAAGSLTGVVQSSGKPVANAQARIDGTSFVASTGADGRFTLANVPAASGYLLKLSAAGFASKQVPGITATSGTKDLGTIQLAPLAGPYRLLPLQPDVNPPVTQIEDGGVGYRYYKVVTADGKTAAGGVAVSVRAAGGSTIPQVGDVSDSWAGRVAGVSDDTGIVRLRIPASALSVGVQTLEVVESGAVKAQFQASVVKFWHDKVWKHQVEAGASTSKAILRLGASGALETEVRDRYAGSLLLDEETIQRSREFEARLGVGFDFPGPSLSVDLGANLRGGFKVIDTYGFPPDTTDQVLNMEKVYMALGDEMSVVLGPAPQIYDELRKIYAPDLYAAILRSTAGEIHGGGEFDASAELGVGSGTSQSLYFGADLEGSIIGYYQAENQFQVGRLVEQTRELGLRTELSTSLNLNAGGHGLSGQTLKKLGLSGNISQKATMAGKVWLDPATSAPLSVGAEFESEVSAGMNLSLLGWQGVGGSLGPGMTMSAKESLRYDLPSAAAYAHIQALSPVWNYLVGSFGAGWRLTGQAGSGLLPAIVVASEQDGVPLTYERSVYRGVTADVAAQADLDKVLDKLGLKFDLSMERGAEAVVEQGVIWQRERLPLKWRPEDTTSLIPSQSIVSKEAQWIGYAAPPLAQAWNRVEQAVASVGDTLIQAGTGAYHAALQFGQGVMSAGSYIITKWTASGSVSGGRAPMMYGLRSLQSKDGNSPNLVYGIGGIYRFESTNSFNGTGTLTIAYSPAEVTGLNPADLRIYYLPDGTNRWQFVGGTVNVASNTVTATISKLGTYTLALPMPTGDLQLTLSTNTMAADGVSQMTVVVTNLMLNTGNVATQQWMFTATAVGVSILNPDLDATTSGVQVMSTNGAVTLLLRAPISGTVGRVNLASVVGDAFGSTSINLLDNAPPATPAGVGVMAGQSRISVSWQTNSEPDLAGYRVYYRMGASGPPWDGTAAVEGMPSPVMVTGTNCLLRGLALGTNYFVAVSAVDTTGNESPLSAPAQVTTASASPAPPTAVVARFGADGTNILMWALSEDDGYNDRDVVRYDVLRAVLPGGNYSKVAEVGAGIGLYSETNLTVSATQYVSYAIVAVASSGSSSAQTLGNRLMASATGFDNDGDGISDWWMMQYFGHPTGQASDQSLAQDDPDRDGLTNLQEYLWGTNPGVAERPHLVPSVSMSNGVFVLSIEGVFGRSVTLQTSPDLSSWVTVTNFNGTNVSIPFEDRTATNSTQRFYRAIMP